MAIAPVFECKNCGDVTDVDAIEIPDLESDDVITVPCCNICDADVRPKQTPDGQQAYKGLTSEEIEAERDRAWLRRKMDPDETDEHDFD